MCRSDEEGTEDFGKNSLSPSRTYCDNNSDVDSSSVSARHDTYNCNSVGTSPSDSPSRIDFTSSRAGLPIQKKGQEKGPIYQYDVPSGQQSMAVLRKPETGTEDAYNTTYFSDDLSIRNGIENSQRPLDFENNEPIWYPPPPEDKDADAESNFFAYDDEDDDIGDSDALFSSNSSISNMFPAKEKHNEGNKV